MAVERTTPPDRRRDDLAKQQRMDTGGQADDSKLPDPAEARMAKARSRKVVKRGFPFDSDVKLGENHARAIKAFAEFLHGKHLLGLRLSKGHRDTVDDPSERRVGTRQVNAKDAPDVVGLDVGPGNEMMVAIGGLKPEISDGVAREIVGVLKNGRMLAALFEHVVKPGSSIQSELIVLPASVSRPADPFEAKDLDTQLDRIVGQAGAPAELTELKERLTKIGDLMTQEDF